MTMRDDGARLSCRQVRRVLQSFLDGEISAERAELVAAHLEACRRCGGEADLLREVIAAIRTLRPDLDLAAWTRLVAAVDQVTSDR